jgi:hypothetical protein
MGDIWKFVREAKVLLADLSGKNPNVFYELGLAHAIAKPVILVSTTIEDVPFDLRGLRVLIYDKDNETWGPDLRKKIEKSLKETLDDIKSAIPPMFLEAHNITRPTDEAQSKELREILTELRALRSERRSELWEADMVPTHNQRVFISQAKFPSRPLSYEPDKGFDVIFHEPEKDENK